MAIAIGDRVKVVGFMVPSCNDGWVSKNERGHIESYTGKIGEVIQIDQDPLHPIMARFKNHTPSVCRFSPTELN
jgi:hypothetical protein